MKKSFTTSTIGAALNTVMAETFTRYFGCIIEKKAGKFVAIGMTFNTLQEAKDGIDAEAKKIKF